MADWGALASGASEGLQQLLAQRLQEQEMQRRLAEDADRMRMAEANRMQERELAGLRAEQERVQLAENARQFGVSSAQRQQQIDEATRRQDFEEQQYREGANLRGLQQMEAERKLQMPVMTPEQEQEYALQRIRESGRQSIAAANAARGGRFTKITTVDENGNPVTRVLPVYEAIGQTYDAAPTADMRNRSQSMGRALPVLDALDELSGRINVSKGLAATATGAVERAKAKANLNDDVAEFEAVVQGFTPLLARSVGHTGVLTEQDVQSVRGALPSPLDQESLAKRKLARFRSIMESSATWGDMRQQLDAAGADTTQPTPGMVTIRNKRTGETLQVPADDPRVRGGQ